MQIHFTLSEMKEILVKNDYIIKTVNSYRSENEYHNKISYTNTKVTIAYLKINPPDKKDLEREENRIIENWGIETVFEEFLKLKVKNLLLNK